MKTLAWITVLATLAQAQENRELVIRSSVREVVLDLTVRNKNEKLVRDLRAEEVEIYVDGERQTVRNFQFVPGEETRKLEASTPVAGTSSAKIGGLPAANSAREINLVALVFRTSNTEQRARARQAALAFVSGELRPHTYIATLTMSRLITRVAQPFTADPALLAASIEKTLSDSGMHEAGVELAALSPPGASSAIRGPGPTGLPIDATNPASSKLDASVATSPGALAVRALEGEAQYTDFNTEAIFEMDRMREILNQMAGLPGRKTVIAMTSTLAIPTEQQEVFRKLIKDAKAMGVTFYGVGLNGLTPSSSMSAASTSTATAATINQTQGKTPAVSRAQSRSEDRMLYGVISADTENALRVLAESTGGMMISNTNDVAHQMPRIMNDVNTHYEVSWTPSETRYDGKFHKIEVKLKRKDLHVQCREGYYAVPDLNGHQFQSFELTGIRTLDSRPLPKDFEFRANALRFNPSGDEWHGVMAFEAPIASFASIAPNAGNMQVVGTAVALVKDARGEIVGMVSDKVSYEIPNNKKDGFLQGNLTLTLPVQLQPGRWTIEATMMSPAMQMSSAKRISVFVPKVATPAISSITLTRRIDPRTAATAMLGPFDIGASRVTPTLTDSVSGGANSQLYFVVYPSPEIAESPQVRVQYFRNGLQVAEDSPAVRNDGSGAIPMLAAAKLVPGEYEVRITAKQGARASRETAWIRVEP